MAMKQLSPIDMNKNEILNAVIQNLATAPSNPKAGQVYFNTTDNVLLYFDGTNWSTIGSDVNIINNLTTTSAGQGALDAYQGKILDDKIKANTTLANSKIAFISVNGEMVTATVSGDNKIVNITVPTKVTDLSDAGNYAKTTDLGTAAFKNTGTASGNVPVLGSDGKLNSSILPALAITDTFVVANETAMLALNAQVGDIAVRTDLNKTFILKQSPASTLANWQEILTPTDAVKSVNGETGVVVLDGNDIQFNALIPDISTEDQSVSDVVGAVYTTLKQTITNMNNSLAKLSNLYYTAMVPGGSTTATITHNLGTTSIIAQVWQNTDNELVYCDIHTVDANSIQISMSNTIPANSYQVRIIRTSNIT